MIYPTLKTFSLLILDMNKVYPKMSLSQFLQGLPAQYCIILNATSVDIESINGTYRVAVDEFRYGSSSTHSTPPCVVLSYKGVHNYFIPPAQITWEYIVNNPCLRIQIQGVNLLLTYLPPHSLKKRRKLLENLETGHFKDSLDIHILITYLDNKNRGIFHPILKGSNLTWYPMSYDIGIDTGSSSFQFFQNGRHNDKCTPDDIAPLSDREQELPLAAGGITCIPPSNKWEVKHLEQHIALDSFSPHNANL
jgi:hypothetical protein